MSIISKEQKAKAIKDKNCKLCNHKLTKHRIIQDRKYAFRGFQCQQCDCSTDKPRNEFAPARVINGEPVPQA